MQKNVCEYAYMNMFVAIITKSWIYAHKHVVVSS